jgi:hypothetical protein
MTDTDTECSWCNDLATVKGVACTRHALLAHDDSILCAHGAKAFDDWCFELVVATDGVKAWCATHQTPDSFPVAASGEYVTEADLEAAVTRHDEVLAATYETWRSDAERAWLVPGVAFVAILGLGWLVIHAVQVFR